MSKRAKLLEHLSSGAEITSKQIEKKFGLKNAAAAIHKLRANGHCIYSNKTISNGVKSIKYKIDTPSRRMVALASAVLGSSAFTR